MSCDRSAIDKGQAWVDVVPEMCWGVRDPELPKKGFVLHYLGVVIDVGPVDVGSVDAFPFENIGFVLHCPGPAFLPGDVQSLSVC